MRVTRSHCTLVCSNLLYERCMEMQYTSDRSYPGPYPLYYYESCYVPPLNKRIVMCGPIARGRNRRKCISYISSFPLKNSPGKPWCLGLGITVFQRTDRIRFRQQPREWSRSIRGIFMHLWKHSHPTPPHPYPCDAVCTFSRCA